jgi:hypothetical protein
LHQSEPTTVKSLPTTSRITITAIVKFQTGTTKAKLKIADLLIFLILIKAIPTLGENLKTGLKISSKHTASMDFVSTLFQRFQRTSGQSLEPLQVCSKWASVSMVTQLMLDLINSQWPPYLTTQCTTLSMMFSEMANIWATSSRDTTLRHLTLKTWAYSVFLLTIMTTLVSYTITEAKMLS